MRVAVVNLTSGGLSGGYRKYLTRLMPMLAKDPRIKGLRVFVPPGVTLPMDSAVDVRSWAPSSAGDGFKALVRDVAAGTPDVVFMPTARYAGFGTIPVVVMVRNMEPLTVPFNGNTWIEGLKNVARAWETGRACRRATRVIAVSEYVHDFIVSKWRLDSARVATVYHGVDVPDLPAAADGDRQPGLLFTAGSIRPARGVEDAIRALPLLDPGVRLVIAGRVDEGCAPYGDRLDRLSRQLGVADRVTFAGQLGPDAMARAFAECAAFVMTSRAEACPNTALEAMSSGCAIVSVDRPPMPEFFGEAALYYPLADARSLAAQLRAVVADTGERDRLGYAARRRAAEFTWDATRDRTIQELERARS